ncbi:hypothetical protein JTB14_026353 [Gonioctena quinquepunctata]|nr:hypothetical protein JTB14_026353 [Gonioctena quinquepunctata]
MAVNAPTDVHGFVRILPRFDRATQIVPFRFRRKKPTNPMLYLKRHFKLDIHLSRLIDIKAVHTYYASHMSRPINKEQEKDSSSDGEEEGSSMHSKIATGIHFCLSKANLKEPAKVQDLLDGNYVENIQLLNSGYKFLIVDRGDPAHWKERSGRCLQ